MSLLQAQTLTDVWVAAPWKEYAQLGKNPVYEKAKGYYYRGHMRLEILPVGFDHGQDHTIVLLAIELFAIVKQPPLTALDSVSYRKEGLQDCQPDVSCYVGDNARAIPSGTNIVNLNQYPVPDLVIEVSKTTLLDDLGTKRSLYEELGVAEYWVLDVQNIQVLAYAMGDRGSQRIDESQILPRLKLATVEDALCRSPSNRSIASWSLVIEPVSESIACKVFFNTCQRFISVVVLKEMPIFSCLPKIEGGVTPHNKAELF